MNNELDNQSTQGDQADPMAAQMATEDEVEETDVVTPEAVATDEADDEAEESDEAPMAEVASEEVADDEMAA